MTQCISFVDFEGRTLFTDAGESSPGETNKTPIILDENSSGMATENSSTPTLDDVNMLPSKVGMLCRGRLHYLPLTVVKTLVVML